MRNSIEGTPGGVVFAGPKATEVFRASAVGSALRLYAKTGIKVNRAYTPAAMMAVAAEITGKKFKARDYAGAAAELKAWAEAQALLINVGNNAAEAQL